MKNFNRRDFLKLTGLTALALTFSACGSSKPDVPATEDAQEILDEINAYRDSKGFKPLVYNKNLENWAAEDIRCFETQNTTKVGGANWSNWHMKADGTDMKPEYASAIDGLKNEGFNSLAPEYFGVKETGTEENKQYDLNVVFPATATELQNQIAELTNQFNDTVRYIGIASAAINGQTYWVAMMLPKKPTDD